MSIRRTQDALNILAGTTGLRDQDCLNIIVGTTQRTSQDCWNIWAGTTGLRAQECANVIAGTVGLRIADCLDLLISPITFGTEQMTNSSLKAWFDSTRRVFNTGTIRATNTQAVATWGDVSGNANNATESTNQPTFRTNVINGKPTVRFDGTNDLLQLATNLDAATSFTCFVVANKRVVSSGYMSLFTTKQMIFLARNITNDFWGVYYNADAPTAQTLNTTFRVMSTVTRAANDVDLYDNGTKITVATGSSYMASTLSQIGANNTLQFLDGDIAEIIFYNATLTAANVARVHLYLSKKYAITVV